MAVGGKFITVQEPKPAGPNGTGFMITTDACPELDATNLVVGRVVCGMDVVRRIQALPANRPRTDIVGAYFKAGKSIGDKRAVVAEKGFNR